MDYTRLYVDRSLEGLREIVQTHVDVTLFGLKVCFYLICTITRRIQNRLPLSNQGLRNIDTA